VIFPGGSRSPTTRSSPRTAMESMALIIWAIRSCEMRVRVLSWRQLVRSSATHSVRRSRTCRADQEPLTLRPPGVRSRFSPLNAWATRSGRWQPTFTNTPVRSPGGLRHRGVSRTNLTECQTLSTLSMTASLDPRRPRCEVVISGTLAAKWHPRSYLNSGSTRASAH
jgi:hypothetical protein